MIVEEEEREVRVRIDDPPELRAAGALVCLENVGLAYGNEGREVVGSVTLGIEQGGRTGLVGAVSCFIMGKSSAALLNRFRTGRGRRRWRGRSLGNSSRYREA